MTAPALPLTPSVAQRLAGRPLLLLLDVDGTLSPIAERPEYAIIPPGTRRVVIELAAMPETHVAIISGRGARDARRLVGVDDLWVIGNHGAEIARPNEPPMARRDVAEFSDRIASAVERCGIIADSVPGVIVEDKRWTLSVHYRLADPRVVPGLSAHVADIADQLGLRITVGKEVLELRPPVAFDKGTASIDLAESLGALGAGASLFCAGDDQTDEDAFRALRAVQPAAVTVFVAGEGGPARSSAEFTVSSPHALCLLLEAIVEHRRPRAAG